MSIEVDFWFDPICPWTWVTRQWLDEVVAARDVRIRHRLMSLTMLNWERRQADGADVDDLVAAWQMLRTLAAAEASLGDEAVGRIYSALGRRLHEEGRSVSSEDLSAVKEAAVEAEVPVDVTWYDVDDRYDPLIRASHDEAVRRTGPDVGSPVLGIGDFTVFGPVVSPAPRGQDAIRLWDAIVLLAEVPGFYELKRGRVGRPLTR
ncbi:MAG: hypothetical protein LBJ08_05395 [Bifidobacteriaceae bacterium]|jgi:hypothetical protein|nr:hypothetical protein [Bifidobacteriaceae bacterium]